MKKIDRMILGLIAAALTVIALNPWVTPAQTQAQGQGGVTWVDIRRIGGVPVDLPSAKPVPGLPVFVLNK
ncbi:MAG: hypothetical protein A3J27_12130 [Candidatus Tectomicrobia bacterium RIFCSPLOWO2_12_FULL_69_37]|nr:MAG: hypothetical protein A3I72_12035 [Candidatus Tectomicrobia bacterium RIFCSPLOWO2_02_FULL_70_19]OGL68817.1 MAG: hypothetical protein A3J27_12130 [Candidatus Tectomicrobia bacterium RIFCSPLOWO2_12_FULL_69_37]